MDVMQTWLVRPREALYDLDNIQLGNLLPEDRIQGVEAVFVLDYLVVEGHARETPTNAPPRGLQLQLTKRNGIPIDDTQVVANLGYLQFKAKAGIFQLELRAGRGRDIYKMESVGTEGWNSPLVEVTGNKITLTSFEGLTLYPRVSKRPGMDGESLSGQQMDELERPSPYRFFQDFISRSVVIFLLSISKH
jgi:UDP-glucose:glycoprotein glucosyltransferase